MVCMYCCSLALGNSYRFCKYRSNFIDKGQEIASLHHSVEERFDGLVENAVDSVCFLFPQIRVREGLGHNCPTRPTCPSSVQFSLNTIPFVRSQRGSTESSEVPSSGSKCSSAAAGRDAISMPLLMLMVCTSFSLNFRCKVL